MKFNELETYQVGKDSVKVLRSKYIYGGTLAIGLVDSKTGEPYADLTVNIESVGASENCAFVDTNNCRWAEKFITENGLGEDTGIKGRSGFCTYPLYKFNLEKMADMELVEYEGNEADEPDEYDLLF